MATEVPDNAPTSILALSDAWFIISEFMTYHDIAAISIINKEANTLINQAPVWEQQCNTFFNTDIGDDENNKTHNRFKTHFANFICIYGHDSIKYYKRVILCWAEFKKWIEMHLPQMLTTFNEPATNEEMHRFKQIICDKDMLRHNNYKHLTAYLIFLGECCNGQNRKLSRMGMYGYYSFYNKASSGHLLSICESIRYTKQVRDVYGNANIADLWLYCAGIPTRDRLITIPCLTFMNKLTGNICKITQDSQIIHLKHCSSNSFIQHLEFYILHNLVRDNYRVNRECGILRYPLCDIATSSCVTRGILCRASPLFIAEISNIKQSNYLFSYHIEIECPTAYCDMNKEIEMKMRCQECNISDSKPYQLTVRKWFIKDNNGKVEPVQGPGVIGLYPKVFINQDLFQYESCSRQNVPTCGQMWGFFVFQQNKNYADATCGEPFELELKPYKLDWNLCQWI